MDKDLPKQLQRMCVNNNIGTSMVLAHVGLNRSNFRRWLEGEACPSEKSLLKLRVGVLFVEYIARANEIFQVQKASGI